MLYKIAHWLKEKFPFVWDIAEWMNKILFSIRYGKKLSQVNSILSKYQDVYEICQAKYEDVDELVRFFAEQPEESFEFFHPHLFDAKTLTKLIKNQSYLFYIVKAGKQIVGYFFLRSFFMGKSYRGKMVDYRWRGKGIAKTMGLVTTDVAQWLGLRMYGTISKRNVTSIASSTAVNEIKIIEELPNDFLYIEYLPKK